LGEKNHGTVAGIQAAIAVKIHPELRIGHGAVNIYSLNGFFGDPDYL